MSNEEYTFFQAVELMAKEKDIPAEYLYEKIANALVVAVKRQYNGKDVVFCDIKPEEEILKLYIRKNVVEEISDEDADILVKEARKYKKNAKPGDIIEIPLDTNELGRVVAQTTKHVIRQGVRDVVRGQTMLEFQKHNQEIVTARVLSVDPKTGNATLEIGRAEAMLPYSEQIPGEQLQDGDLIKVYIVDVRETEKGPKAMISRTHLGLVRRLFETEVPEITEGVVEIMEVSREAGSRTKIAVYSRDENVDAVGACIGPRGARVGKVVDLLHGEKIDIVPYSEDPAQFIGAALAPADVISVEILSEEEKSCKVIVPDTQLSLAIGNKGQNARLAAKLTGWKIDINPESGFYESSDEDEETVETEEIEETVETEEIYETVETEEIEEIEEVEE
ncbi:MAG: transcription termination/antitermination protein NusA [Ruminococcaceae bacterium]|nr:transcription termination/antitermination protein NusA [Oscillospiraceae bacterium]